jgi:mRNA-degrading endonuclease RelE of RelBE toxin-antitoxin system
MPTHKWHLEVTDSARKDIDNLPTSKDVLGVFASIRQLLISENPSMVPGVRKLVEKRFEGQWRQRSGDWRIFFIFDPTEVAFMKYTYKGTVTILGVVRRDRAY